MKVATYNVNGGARRATAHDGHFAKSGHAADAATTCFLPEGSCYFSVQPSVDLRSSARIGPPRRPSASANLWNCSSWIISAAY